MTSSITEAAIAWFQVRQKIFVKEKMDLSDWNELGEAENNLMRVCKEEVLGYE